MHLRRAPVVLVSALLCVAALRLSALPQSPAPQSPPPTFRSNVDLLTLEASVRDRRGTPVSDLQASDFTVTIDGRPRQVVFAHFFKADAASGERLTVGAPPTPRHVTNDETMPGRVVVFALDLETIRAGQEKPLLETASRMLDRLSPADAAGLVSLPGPSIDVTRDRKRVADGLTKLVGAQPGSLWDHTVSYDEALAFDRQDRATISTVIARECAGADEKCPGDLRLQARDILVQGRAHARHVLSAVTTLLKQMSVLRAPRHVILLSGGLPFDSEILSLYNDLARAAAEARVILYTIRVEQTTMEAAAEGNAKPGALAFGDPALENGLANLASMTGGMYFRGIARGTGVFDRVASEVTTFYELGVEGSKADADGKPHDVKVRVGAPGLDVRAPAHVLVAAKRSAPRDALAVALQQPTDVPDVPLAITTYSTHGTGTALRLLVSAEIGAPNSAAPAEWGLALTQNGKGVVTTRGRIPAGSERPRIVTTDVEVPPGTYQLRVAAVDADDRAGVLEVPITVGYRVAGTALLSDLVVGVAKGGQLEPRRRIAQSDDVTAMLEVSAGAPADVGGTLQLIRSGTARSVLNVPLSIRPATSAGGPAVLQARAPLGAVPPGRYTASAALESGGQPLARISRIIEIIESPPVTSQSDVVATPAAVGDTAAPPPPPAVVPATEPIDASVRSPDEVMRRVGAYVERYGGQASLLVGVERYTQSVRVPAGVLSPETIVGSRPRFMDVTASHSEKRQLVSEFVLVPNASASGGWLGYRDVIEVNGKPVADRRDRLQGLFRSDAPDLQEARRIADESARYNIGPVSRNFNVPTATLFFFHTGNLPRFTFRNKRSERIDGIDAVAVDFRETRRPTLIMNASGKDVPSSGTLWINPADGAVVRTRLELDGFRGAASHAVIDVTYRKDPTLAMWVPARMLEHYSGGATGTASTVATYADFKRFQTSGRVTIPK